MGKHKHSKAMFLIHISCEALIHTSPKIWREKKVNSHSKGKIWENTNISKLRVS